MPNNISNPVGGHPLDLKVFENIAKDAKVSNKSTIHLATDSSGKVIQGLQAKSPFAGKLVVLLSKPITNLGKASAAQRNGILATQAFKQALIQRYGEAVANAVDKHMIKSGNAKILTAQDLRKNLKVAAAIVKILKETPRSAATPITPESLAARNSRLSNSSGRRNEDGSSLEPSAPPRSRSSSNSSENSVDAFFRGNNHQPIALLKIYVPAHLRDHVLQAKFQRLIKRVINGITTLSMSRSMML